MTTVATNARAGRGAGRRAATPVLAALCLAILAPLAAGQEIDPAAATDADARADSLDAAVQTLERAGRIPAAIALADSILAARRAEPDTDPEGLVRALRRLGRLQQRASDYPAADPLLREALEITLTTRGEENLAAAEAQLDLAWNQLRLGENAAAEPLFRRALGLHRRLLDGDHPLLARNLRGMGALLARNGDFAGAEPYFREALAMNRRLSGEDDPELAWSMSSLAGVLSEQGHYEEAKALIEEALVLMRRQFPPGQASMPVSALEHNLALVSMQAGDLPAAETHFRASLEMIRELMGERTRYYAAFTHVLANVLREQGRLDEAGALYAESLEVYRLLFGEHHPDLNQVLYDQALCLLAGGRTEEAEPLMRQSTACFEGARRRAGVGFTRATYHESPYSYLAALNLLLGRVAEAWPAAEASLGRVLADLLFLGGERDLSPAEVAREDSLVRDLDACEARLAAVQAAADDDPQAVAEALRDARGELLEAEARWISFQHDLSLSHPLTEGRVFPLARVQAALSAGTAILGWLEVEQRPGEILTWGYVVRHEGPVRWERLDPDGGDRDGEATATTPFGFRQALTQAAAWPLRVRDVTRIQAASRELHECWIAPLLPHLEGVESLVVIPAGPLLGIPVEAFADADDVPLGDRFAVSYTPSATVHTWLHEHHRAAQPHPRRALLLGDPPFTTEQQLAMREGGPGDEAGLVLATASAALSPGVLRSALAGNETALASLPRLPWSRQEVLRVASVVPGATLLVGPDASEQELIRLAESGELLTYDIIHLATHALVDEAGPEHSALVLSRTGLPDALTASRTGDRVYDGLLTVKEIMRHWRLDAELVTLSGCQTALGTESHGEGYLGLTQALLQAGARSLLVSLWRVEDEATCLLMSRFYENLAGTRADAGTGRRAEPLGKAEALREARTWLREYRDDDGGQPFRHPAYWSGFVLLGDPD